MSDTEDSTETPDPQAQVCGPGSDNPQLWQGEVQIAVAEAASASISISDLEAMAGSSPPPLANA